MHWQLSKMPRARLRQLTRMVVASNHYPSRLSTTTTSRAVSDGLWPTNHSLLPYRGVSGTAHICACTIRTFQRSTYGMPILGPSPMNPTQPSQVHHSSIQLGGLVGTNGAAPSLRRLRHEVRSAVQGAGPSKVPHVQLGAPTSLLAFNPCCPPRFPLALWDPILVGWPAGSRYPCAYVYALHMYMAWFSSGVSVCTCTACLPLSSSPPSTSYTPDSPRWGHPMSWLFSPGSRLSSRP